MTLHGMRFLAAPALLLALTGAAQAQMLGELRGGVYVHDLGGALTSPTPIEDANVEFLFKPLVDGYVFGSLHPHVGITASLGGAASYGYAGLTWHLPVPLTPVFAEAGLGAALSTTGLAGGQPGCAVLFHAEGSVGVSFAGVADLMLTAEHYRPATACGTAPPVTNVGARVGVSF
jgi:hypothetical protein